MNSDDNLRRASAVVITVLFRGFSFWLCVQLVDDCHQRDSLTTAPVRSFDRFSPHCRSVATYETFTRCRLKRYIAYLGVCCLGGGEIAWTKKRLGGFCLDEEEIGKILPGRRRDEEVYLYE